MEFEVQGKKHVLRGGSASMELKTVSAKQLDKLLPHSSRCFFGQICSLQVVEDMGIHCSINGVTLVNDDRGPKPVTELLQQYAALFQEPT